MRLVANILNPSYVIWLLLLISGAACANALPSPLALQANDATLAKVLSRLDTINKKLVQNRYLSADQLTSMQVETLLIVARANRCVRDQKIILQNKTASKSASKMRQARERYELCHALRDRAKQLNSAIQGRISRRFHWALFGTRMSLKHMLGGIMHPLARDISRQTAGLGTKWLGRERIGNVPFIIVGAIFGLAFGLLFGGLLRRWGFSRDSHRSGGPIAALGQAVNNLDPWYLPMLGLVGGISTVYSFLPQAAMARSSALALLGVLAGFASISIFLPREPLSGHPSIHLHRPYRVRFLVRLGLPVTAFGFLLLSDSFRVLWSPAFGQLIHALWITVAGAVAVAALTLIRLKKGSLISVGPLAAAVVAAGIVSVWLGFPKLSDYLVAGGVESAGFVAAAWALVALARDLFDGLEQGRANWHKRVRALLRRSNTQPIPGLLWMRLLLLAVLWGCLILGLIDVWAPPGTAQRWIVRYLIGGFSLGSATIVPAQLLAAALLFGLLLLLAGQIKARLERQLSGSAVDHGKRMAVVKLTEYSLWALSAAIALSVGGFGFRNLALVAGALSVGIGFGLQNIVSNFVSGLILLFERPVRPGDWVVIGSTQGYVRRIHIRATVIETFDHAEVLVPNSELISQQVTNWTLSNPQGRIIVPVGVAYGSDTTAIKELLYNVALGHPDVVRDSLGVPDPVVLFRGFGDSSLSFELRVFIRDISQFLKVSSDLNFAIDSTFREHGVEIPFPQRDIHIRTATQGQ